MNLTALKARIKPLDISRPPAISDEERDYFRHYGLDFEERFPEVTHYFGQLESDHFHLVTHYFRHSAAEKTCFIVHGYFDHVGLFSKLIDFCLQKKISVVAFDLPGHGLSTGARASISSFSHYQQSLMSILAFFRGVAPAPWYAIGQSTGAAILMDFILSTGSATFDKTVLLAPLYRPAGWGSSRHLHTIVYPFFKQFRRHFSANSHDGEFVDFLRRRDPLQHNYLSLVWVAALKKWLRHYDSLPQSEYAPLIIQGEEDTTVDWRQNIPVIRKKFPRAKVLYLKEGRHHLANEREDIREKILAAIDLYLAASSRQLQG